MRTRRSSIFALLVVCACHSPTSAPPPAPSPSIAAPPESTDAPGVSVVAPTVDDSAAVALLEAIAGDIEALGASFPQLADFRVESSFHRGGLTIDFAHHTHAPTHPGGWTAAVPEPDDDGIWLYIDLHDPASRAQIHTQPVVPEIDVLGRKLMMLVLEGKGTHGCAGALRAILARRARAASDAGAGTPR